MSANEDPNLENVLEIVRMLEEIGGSAEVLTWATPAALAEQFQVLRQRLNTHVIVIGSVPISAPRHDDQT